MCAGQEESCSRRPLTAAVLGVEAHLVRVEADTAAGFPKFTMLGLPDSSIKESEGRIRAALRNCGYDFKWDRRITVSMAPASLRKMGSSYDLATAVGLLAADGALPTPPLERVLIVGELALDGTVRPVPGVLPMMLMARQQGLSAAVVPLANAARGGIVDGLPIYPVRSLPEAVDLAGAANRPPPPPRLAAPASSTGALDMADVRGQVLARRALEVAAAGGHNLLLVGPPGSGKTMLARRLPGHPAAPDAGRGAGDHGHPFRLGRRPHRRSSRSGRSAAPITRPATPPWWAAGPTRARARSAWPTTASCSWTSCRSSGATSSRRSASRWRSVRSHIARARATIRLPARFQLVAAMNPCPCGGGAGTRPAAARRRRVRRVRLPRISGPLLDRIDLRVDVPARDLGRDVRAAGGEPSDVVGMRVRAARERGRQARRRRPARHQQPSWTAPGLRASARLDAEGQHLLASAMERLRLSARAHDRVLRVARTLADLDGAEVVVAGPRGGGPAVPACGPRT